MNKTNITALVLLTLLIIACNRQNQVSFNTIADVAEGWSGEVIARVDQSYAGWDVEIGDADNDGRNEILTTGCPNSRLYMFKESKGQWETRLIADNLAAAYPGMGLAVKISDLNRDGRNEILVGTGHENGENPLFHILQWVNDSLSALSTSRPEFNKSSYTHNLAIYDLDNDGVNEVIAAYCGNGEIIRYDMDQHLKSINASLIHKLSGSGEESLIADIDNDGKPEYITSNAFRDEEASVEIFEFSDSGNLILPPRIVIDGFDGNKCFYASATAGDLDNDGQNELIIGWKRKQKINKGTLLAYKIKDEAIPVYTLSYEDDDMDLSYFEKMMAVDDADNDGLNELIISTRGDEMSELITSKHLGYVFMFSVSSEKQISKTLLTDLNEEFGESSWLAVGDADNDNLNEIILATGKGDRTKSGTSYILMIKKSN
jgi:hypothetical protein